jgi:cell division septation protein DedD
MKRSTPSIFFGSLGLLLLLAWIFFLGVLAGRGVFSEGLDKISNLLFREGKQQEDRRPEDPSPSKPSKHLDKTPKFKFYKGLSGEGEEKAGTDRARKNEKGLDQGKPVPTPSSKGRYTVQLASLSSEIQAARMVDRLVKRGYRAYFYGVRINGKLHFRVRCGRFTDIREANDMRTRLAKQEKLSGFVTAVEDQE